MLNKIGSVGVVLSGINMTLFVYFIYRDWQLCSWPFECGLSSGPFEVSEHTLSLQLGILQSTLVGIAVGLAIMGTISFKTVQEIAIRRAESAVEARLDHLSLPDKKSNSLIEDEDDDDASVIDSDPEK
ncbi:MAG: hypothetical protein OXC13_16740 [Caldilineaceae bacterium]|nr:hypothetical protein [Caldilineaceae bacterium]